MDKIRTRDHHVIEIGDIISDFTGIYKVTEIGRFVILTELIFDPDSDDPVIGDERKLLPSEIGKMYYK